MEKRRSVRNFLMKFKRNLKKIEEKFLQNQKKDKKICLNFNLFHIQFKNYKNDKYSEIFFYITSYHYITLY